MQRLGSNPDLSFKLRYTSPSWAIIFDPIVNHFSQLIVIVMVLVSSVMVIFFSTGAISLFKKIY